MSIWKLLESVLREDRQYRGNNNMRMVDIRKLVDEISKKGGLIDGGNINPDGGVVICDYSFDPKIWGKWYPSQNAALAIASTDKDVVDQHAGRSQGHTVVKQNWGGHVSGAPGKPRGDFEMMPSAMDRYDILMQGDVTQTIGRDKKPKLRGKLVALAYSPSMGSAEDRKMRLVALISGQKPTPLARRPQPEVPGASKKDLTKWDDANAKAHAIQTARKTAAQKDTEDPEHTDDVQHMGDRGGSASNQDFKDRMARYNAAYVPSAAKPSHDEPDEDDPDRLFHPKSLPRSSR